MSLWVWEWRDDFEEIDEEIDEDLPEVPDEGVAFTPRSIQGFCGLSTGHAIESRIISRALHSNGLWITITTRRRCLVCGFRSTRINYEQSPRFPDANALLAARNQREKFKKDRTK